MIFFCNHKWIVIAKTFSPPIQGGTYCGHRDLLRLANGMTTVLCKCNECGKLKSVEMIGR